MRIFAFLLSLIPFFAEASIAIGKPAPDFTLMSHTGEKVQLSSFKGKTVVLEWYNYGCPFVRKHYDTKNMQNTQSKYKDKVVWLSIVSSAKGKQGFLATTSEAAEKYKEEGMSSHALLLDHNGDVGRLFGAKVTPHMFIINDQGNVVYEGAIDNILSANPADVAKATNYVALALDELFQGQKIKKARSDAYGCAVKY
ncbi:MAG: thioredoxin family protein [Bdellovibrio sp.]